MTCIKMYAKSFIILKTLLDNLVNNYLEAYIYLFKFLVLKIYMYLIPIHKNVYIYTYVSKINICYTFIYDHFDIFVLI